MSVTMTEMKDGLVKFIDGTDAKFPPGLTYRIAKNTGAKIIVEMFAEDGVKIAAVVVGATKRSVMDTIAMVETELKNRSKVKA